jgi:type IV secretion system protein VirB9
MRYPGEERAKRDAEASKARKSYLRSKTEQTVVDAAAGRGTTTRFLNDHYYGSGEKTLAPQESTPGAKDAVTDDGQFTRLTFPGHTETPAITKLGNHDKGCGPDGEESAVDAQMYGDKMVIAGTAVGWCLRKNNRVYQIDNDSYNAVGYSTGTGTPSPQVERVVKGGAR